MGGVVNCCDKKPAYLALGSQRKVRKNPLEGNRGNASLALEAYVKYQVME